ICWNICVTPCTFETFRTMEQSDEDTDEELNLEETDDESTIEE
ncbi:unnamed protein product, partial [Rotaria sp. Silwood1]